MISDRPCIKCTNGDMKVLSDKVEEYMARSMKCPECHQRKLFVIKGSQSFTDLMCMDCRCRIEVKSIRCMGFWQNMNQDKIKNGFTVKLGSKNGFTELCAKGHVHLLIVWYFYDMLPGYDINNDFDIEGIINQRFEYALLLRKEKIKKICNNELLNVEFVAGKKNKIDMKVLPKGICYFDVIRPTRHLRSDSKEYTDIQNDVDDAMLLVDTSEEMEIINHRANRKRKKLVQKIKRQLLKKHRKEFTSQLISCR